MIKFFFIFIISITLVSCSNWRYQTVPYLRCGNLDEIHVHFYNHETCESSCLFLEEKNHIFVDRFKVKYKIDKKGKVKKAKLVK